jgi:hypothetical protein
MAGRRVLPRQLPLAGAWAGDASPSGIKKCKIAPLDGIRFVKARPDHKAKKPEDRRARTRTAIAFVLLFVFLGVGGYFALTFGSLRERVGAIQTQSALQEIGDAQDFDAALRAHPQNRVLLTIDKAARAAQQTSVAADKLLAEIEPASLARTIDYSKASRADLDAFRSDLKGAEAKATAFAPQYLALLKSERGEVERYATSLNVGKDTLAKMMDNLDNRRAAASAVMAKVSSARADFYRAYEKYVAMLEGELGGFRIVNGEFIFPLQRTVDRYNAAAQAMTSAAKRVAESEEERKNVTQSQRENWIQLAAGK